jgi:PhnB protein
MTNTTIQPDLFFGGRCQEAVDFYKTILGAEVDMKKPLPRVRLF